MNTHHIPVNASPEEQFQIGFERGFENGLRASPGGGFRAGRSQESPKMTAWLGSIGENLLTDSLDKIHQQIECM